MLRFYTTNIVSLASHLAQINSQHKSLKSAVYNVACKSIHKAAEEVKSKLPEGTIDCGVSVDGCWQKRLPVP